MLFVFQGQTPTQRQLLEAAPNFNRITFVTQFLEANIVGAVDHILHVRTLFMDYLEVDTLKSQFLEIHLAFVLMTASAGSPLPQTCMALNTG